jgi:alpha-ketoglutarate-dependent taurine dioxygenase
MEQQYAGVVRRTLESNERRIREIVDCTPLVIEPLKSSSGMFLRQFLDEYSPQILEDIAKYGALLIRGFDVDSPKEFEKVIHSIRSMRGMYEILLSEEGRTLAEGSRFVFYTNKKAKPRASMQFGYFHTENYNVPDLPHYVSFWCGRPPKLGGETGLVNMAKVYSDLPDAVKQKLEERKCLSSLYRITAMVERYGLHEEPIKQFCDRVGLPVLGLDGVHYVAVFKPSVVEHPMTRERALLVNSLWLPSLEKPLLRAFSADYLGPEWALHRLYWKTSWLTLIAKRALVRRVLHSGTIYATEMRPLLRDARLLCSLFSHEEIELLAASMRSRYTSFTWKRGDILILDNLKMAHNGMPGRGARELRVMLCNPVPLPLGAGGPGLHIVANPSNECESLGGQLVSFRDSASGLAQQSL